MGQPAGINGVGFGADTQSLGKLPSPSGVEPGDRKAVFAEISFDPLVIGASGFIDDAIWMGGV